MAILWMEGFETWQTQTTTTAQTFNYTKGGVRLIGNPTLGFDIIATGQRNGIGKFMRFHWDATHTYLQNQMDFSAATSFRSVFNTSQTWIMGFAFRVSALPATNRIALCRFNCNGKDNVYVCLDSTGKLKLSKATTLMADLTNTSSILTNTWYYLEVKMKRSTSSVAGDYEIRIDGATVMTPVTGQVRTNDPWTDFCLGDEGNQAFSATGSGSIDYDDFYLIDDQGSKNNTFLGDCMVETLFPNGAGASTQWTPNSGANYTRVNEGFQDGDTTYISTSGVGNRDSYTMDDLSSLPTTVFGVHVIALARRDAGETTRTFNVSIRSGGTYSDGPTSPVLAAAYSTVYSTTSTASARAIFENDPSSAAWTGTTINSIEAGIKLVN